VLDVMTPGGGVNVNQALGRTKRQANGMPMHGHYDAYPITDQKGGVSLRLARRLNVLHSTHRAD